jgi:hypothetical protein
MEDRASCLKARDPPLFRHMETPIFANAAELS